jgi:hypothetical protein
MLDLTPAVLRGVKPPSFWINPGKAGRTASSRSRSVKRLPYVYADQKNQQTKAGLGRRV